MKYISLESLSLMEVLQQMAPDSSKTTLRSWLKDGRVSVDGEMIKVGTTRVRKGQQIEVGARSRYLGRSQLLIHYEDSHIVVIEKPAGLLSVATAFEKGKTLHGLLKEHYHPRKVYVVHRLDQDTSGVMLFALSEQAYERLKESFEKHEIERRYAAVVEGVLTSSEGTWESYLYEDPNYVVRSVEDQTKGVLAVTHYEVRAVHRNRSLLDLKLETGRKNQIRVHCRDAGCPVVGDKKYGALSNPLKRLCLHAHVLGFVHPITKKKMRFESPIPEAFFSVMR